MSPARHLNLFVTIFCQATSPASTRKLGRSKIKCISPTWNTSFSGCSELEARRFPKHAIQSGQNDTWCVKVLFYLRKTLFYQISFATKHMKRIKGTPHIPYFTLSYYTMVTHYGNAYCTAVCRTFLCSILDYAKLYYSIAYYSMVKYSTISCNVT